MMQVCELKKFLSVLMCMAIMVTTLLPNLSFGAAAEEMSEANDSANITEQIQTQVSETSSDDAFILHELVEEREANIKRFMMSDGTITAAVYDEDVHCL